MSQDEATDDLVPPGPNVEPQMTLKKRKELWAKCKAAAKRVRHLAPIQIFHEENYSVLSETLSPETKKDGALALALVVLIMHRARHPPSQNDYFRRRPAEIIERLMGFLAETDKKATSAAMQSCEFLYLSGARHLFKEVSLDLGRLNYHLRTEEMDRVRKGLVRKMHQWSKKIEIYVPDTPKAQKSFGVVVQMLGRIALHELYFRKGSRLSKKNQEKLSEQLEPEEPLRKSIRKLCIPELTYEDAITLPPAPDGTKQFMDLMMDLKFVSVSDPQHTVQMLSEGHLAQGNNISTRSHKKTAQDFLEPYRQSPDWKGFLTIQGHQLAPRTRVRFGNAIEYAGLGSSTQPARNLPEVTFKDLNFAQVNPMLFRSLDLGKVKALSLYECTELLVLFYYIMLYTVKMGIRVLVIVNQRQEEQHVDLHLYNLFNFVKDWNDLNTVSISTYVRWPLPLDMLSNHSNLTSVHYDIRSEDVDIQWLDKLIEFNPLLTNLSICCHDISDVLVLAGAEFEDHYTIDQMMRLATRLAKLRRPLSLALNLRHYREDSLSHPAPDSLGHLYPAEALVMLMLPYFVKGAINAGHPTTSLREIRFKQKSVPSEIASGSECSSQNDIVCEIEQVVEANRIFKNAKAKEREEKRKMRHRKQSFSSETNQETSDVEEETEDETDDEC